MIVFWQRGRHVGSLETPLGEISPTGREVEIRVIDVLSMTDGRISAIQVVPDTLGLAIQLGAVQLAQREPDGEGRAVARLELTDLALSEQAALFQGKDYGSSVSFFVTTHERGKGPNLHTHPYDETFLVEQGSAVFTVGDETVEARAGHILVVPTGAVHGFTSAGDQPLKLVSIHPAPEVQTEWVA